MALRLRHGLAVGLACAFTASAALAEGTYEPSAIRCEKDLGSAYEFYEKNIAPTPNPQLTLETGIYIRRDGQPETYEALLRRISQYAVNWC